MPTRSALPVAALKMATLDWWIDKVLSTTPPVVPFIGFGLTCFFTTLTPSTTTRSSSTRDSTVPRLPLSRPVNTMTWSPLRILFMADEPLQNFRCQRDDLHETLGAQFARHRPEDAGADRLELGVQQHGGVAVELDQRAVLAAHALGGANDDGAVDLALLHATARRSFLDADLDHVTDRGITALRATEHLDAHDGFRARVVRDVEPRLHLNHLSFPQLAAVTLLGAPSPAVLGPWLGKENCCFDRRVRHQAKPHFGRSRRLCTEQGALSKRPRRSGLRLRQQRVGVADLELAGALDVQRLDDAIDDEHRIALRTHAHAARCQVEGQPGRLREVGAAVGHHAHLAGSLLVATPGPHHERVVHRDAPDLVDAGVLEFFRLLDVARHVLGRAGRRERAGQAEHGDLLASRQLVELEGVRADRAAVTFDFDEFLQL